MSIELTKDKMEEYFKQYLRVIFSHSEIKSVLSKEIVITRETIDEAGKQAFDANYHDKYSDIDMSIKVCLPKDGSVTPEEYNKRIDRFGVSSDTALGFMFVPDNRIYRIIFKNGMRYDFGFDFEYDGQEPLVLEPYAAKEDNANWPADNIDRFWFIQVQALGKLYRKDYIISNHLANMNCNDTLVMQMVLRDLEYKTNHHRYGHAEELEYVKDLGKNPYKHDDSTFNLIADHLYAAALAYDRLAKFFYPEYQDRSRDFLAIWDWYES